MHFHSVILTQGQSLLVSSGNSVVVQGVLNLAKIILRKSVETPNMARKSKRKLAE